MVSHVQSVSASLSFRLPLHGLCCVVVSSKLLGSGHCTGEWECVLCFVRVYQKTGCIFTTSVSHLSHCLGFVTTATAIHRESLFRRV